MSSNCFFFSKFYIFHRQFGQYIPTELFFRYILTELPIEYMPSVIIIDNKGLSVKTDKVRHEIISIGKNY